MRQKGCIMVTFELTLGGQHYGEILTLPVGGLHVKHTVQCSGILGTNSAFALGPRKTTVTLDRVGRSQDLPDANWLLASSPALNSRTLTLVPICAVALFETTVILGTSLCSRGTDYTENTAFSIIAKACLSHRCIETSTARIYRGHCCYCCVRKPHRKHSCLYCCVTQTT
jgi:hypothetical protein